MNGYDLSKQWFDFRFEDGRVRSIHTELFFYIVNLWNRVGQKSEFGLPTQDTMISLKIGSYNTYKKALADLVEFGFVTIVKASLNQHSSKVISLNKIDTSKYKAYRRFLKNSIDNYDYAVSKTDEATDRANELAEMKNVLEKTSAISISDEASDEATDTIIEPKNYITNSISNIPETSVSVLVEIPFEDSETVKQPFKREMQFPAAAKTKSAAPKKEKPAAHPAYQPIVQHWLKVVHPGWTFGAMTGTKVKSIIRKLETMLGQNNVDASPENVVGYFQLVCANLPNWYKDKDLSVIDSHFNTIIQNIQNTINGTNTATTPASRYSAIKQAAYEYFGEDDDEG